MWANTRSILLWSLAALIVLGLLFDSFTRRHVREGDQCGPQHHWVYGVSGSGLSCEPDR
jgi:hypothetical protein